MWFDLILKNGRVIDGAGNPWFRADVALEDGRIRKIGKISDSRAVRIIDVGGRVITPGFIDIHNHSDLSFLTDPKMESKVRQGVTTEVNGNCGSSPAPINEKTRRLRKLEHIPSEKIDWTTMDGYFKHLEKQGISQNSITLVGHGTVRYYVMGDVANERASTLSEMEEMSKVVREAMEDGAAGLSSGLDYAPGCYAHTDEIVELCKVVAEYDGIYTSHLRESSSKVLGWTGDQGAHLEAIAEAIDIGRRSHVRAVELSHICGQRPYVHDTDLVNKVRRMIDSAREDGIDVTADVLPSEWGSVAPWPRRSVFSPAYFKEGKEKLIDRLRNPVERAKIKEELMTKPLSEMDFENTTFRLLCIREGKGDCIMIFPPFNGRLKKRDYEWKTLEKISRIKGKDLMDTLLDLIVEEEGNFSVCHKVMDYDLTMSQLMWPTTMPASDGGSTEKPCTAMERVRLTAFGGFPMALAWAREKKIVTLEDMVRRMTSMPARTIGLKDRGLIKEGFWADIVVFDPSTVQSNCSIENDARPEYPVGIPYVIVNGKVVVDNSEHTDALPGRVLRHPL